MGICDSHVQERLGHENQDRQERAAAHIASLERKLADAGQNNSVLTERVHKLEVCTTWPAMIV